MFAVERVHSEYGAALEQLKMEQLKIHRCWSPHMILFFTTSQDLITR